MCAAVFHQWLNEYCTLKRQLSLTCRRNVYLWRHPTNNSTTVSNSSSEVAKRQTKARSAADNAIFTNRAQIIECSFGCVTRSAVLLKPNIANILIFNCGEQKFVQHGPITIAIDCNALSLLIFAEKWPNYNSVPNSVSFWVRRLFNTCVRVFYAQNAKILLVYIPAKIKMSFIWKDDFFFDKIGVYKSIAGPLPSIVQEYTQPYSFGERIKLIIF